MLIMCVCNSYRKDSDNLINCQINQNLFSTYDNPCVVEHTLVAMNYIHKLMQ